jgi:hypothetical protein
MPQNLLAVHGVIGFVCAVGESGRIPHFGGSVYEAREVESPTLHTLRAVFVESPWAAWACGDAGTVLRWNGTQWWPQAVATRIDALNAIWGHPVDGVWIGGRKHLIHYHSTNGGMLINSDAEIRALWGTGPDDIWYLCAGRLALHWQGQTCDRYDLPGDDDEEWSAVVGDGEGRVYLVGPLGFMLCWDGHGWTEIDTETEDLLTGAVCAGPLLYVTTDGGMVREYDGRRWRTVAFSAFGALNAVAYVDGVVWACGTRGVTLQHQPEGGTP